MCLEFVSRIFHPLSLLLVLHFFNGVSESVLFVRSHLFVLAACDQLLPA